MGKVGSIFDLIELYAKKQSKKPDKKKLETVEITFFKLAQIGLCYEDIEKYLKSINNIDIMDIYQHLSTSKHIKRENLLTNVGSIDLSKRQKVIYKNLYHNELLITPAPYSVGYDINTGEFVREEYEYFLEYKFSYTLDNLYNYYMSKKYLCNKKTADKTRFTRHLFDLVRRYGLENVLFMIDSAESILENLQYKILSNPYGIVDYYSNAIDLRNLKISQNACNKSNAIVRRKRLLSN